MSEEKKSVSEIAGEIAERIVGYVEHCDYEALENLYKLCFGEDDLLESFYKAQEDA